LFFHRFCYFQQLLKIIITVKDIGCQEVFSLFLIFSAIAENVRDRVAGVQIPAPPPVSSYKINGLHSRTSVTRPSLRKLFHYRNTITSA
jgi:hypothetical protein